MARELDIVLFGATGFTGKHVVPVLYKLSQRNIPRLTWGIAGRSEQKLKTILSECEGAAGTSLQNIPIIMATVEDDESLKSMARKARIIINCCGPYRFYGEPVVKACIEEGTHHIDVSGEPQYMEEMQVKYHQAAQEKGIYIISACGYDSIPADLGVIYLQQNFSGTLNSVVSCLRVWNEDESISGSTVNYATWESAVHGLAHAHELGSIRRQLFSKKLPSYKPKLVSKTFPYKEDSMSDWNCPFLGADRSVVKRTQYYLYTNESKRPVQIETYFIIRSLLYIIGYIILGYILPRLVKYEFGKKLLLQNPKIFTLGLISKDPPKEETLKTSRFSLTLSGEGWKDQLPDASDQYSSPVDKVISAKVSGTDPGYGTTCTCVVLAAKTVITESDKLPPSGGVYPPGYAFANTSLIKQLNENGVNFEIVYEKDLPLSSKL